MVDHRQDGDHQRAGIDRSVILDNSKQVLVDEKGRRLTSDQFERYQDIMLEFLHRPINCARDDWPGWVCKPLRADFIAYAIVSVGICYLLPVPQLQRAWSVHESEWLSKYGIREAANESYKTLNCPVPTKVLYASIGKQFRVSFEPYHGEWSQ